MKLSTKIISYRLYFVASFLLLFAFAVALKLVYIQIIDGDK